MAMSEGQLEIKKLAESGFSGEEIEAWRNQTASELTAAGFSGTEISEYFNGPEPDMSKTKSMIETNLSRLNAPKVTTNASAETLPGNPPVSLPTAREAATTEGVAKPEVKEATTFLEAVEAGFDISVTGLLKGPVDRILPEKAPMFHRIASSLGTIVGDVPAMIPGAVAGGAGGTAVAGPVGGVVGAGAGSFAIPEAMREALMQHYEKGDIQDFGDFWERSSAVFIKAAKGAAIGGITAGVGGKVAKVLGPAAAPTVKNAAVTASEIATMVTVGSALEGEAPRAQDFTDAAALVLGMKGVAKGASKIRNIYAKTGVKPEQVFAHAQKDPIVKQELIAKNIEVPKAYESLVGKKLTEAKFTEIAPANQSNVVGGKANALRVEPITVESAKKTVAERIGTVTEKPKEPVKFNDIYRDWVDAKDPLNVLVKMADGEKFDMGKDPYIASRLFVDHTNKTKHWFEFGAIDYKTNQPVKGSVPLQKIVAPFTKDIAKYDDFQSYLVSKRALELEARGKKTGVPLEEAKLLVQAGEREFGTAAKQIVEYQNSLSKYMKDAGFLSEQNYKQMLETNKDYVPFYRLLEDDGGVQPKGSRGLLNPFKKIKGSEEKIQSPLESIAKNTGLYVKRAEQNRAVLAFVDFANAKGLMGTEVIEKISAPMKRIEIKEAELAKIFKDMGLEPTAENVAIFRPQALKLGENDIPVFRNGKMEVYRMQPEIAKIYRQMDGSPATNIFIKMMAPFASLQRATIAITPDFILRNKIRDEVTAATFSKYKSMPVYDSLAAMGDIFKKSEAYQAWLRSGGGNGSFLEINSKYIEKDLYKLNKQTGFLDNALNVVKSPIEMIGIVSNVIENSTRIAAFKNAVKATGKSYGEMTFAEMAEAGMQSREITVDFARMGAKTQAINQITAYWNVGVQGLDRTARAFQADPVGASARAAAYVTLPSVLLWWANHDDPRWKEIPNWQKDAFWIVMTDDVIYRIPKPMELGLLFGSLPERVLEAYVADNPDAFDELNETMLSTFGKNFTPVPTALSPVLEHWANKSFFTGNPIISSRYEKLFPEYQYSEHTTESAKLLGQFVSALPGMKENSLASPLVMENYVRAWSGNTGMYALQVADKLLTEAGVVSEPPQPTSTLADIPFVKAFVVRYPSGNTQSIVDFEERYQTQKKAVDTIRYLAKQGNLEDFQKEMGLSQRNGDLMKLDGINQMISNSNRMIQFINRNPEMTPDEKREMIDSLYYGMIEGARQGKELQRELDKALGID